MGLDAVPRGSRIFIDSTVFVYHFTGASAECRRLLERCESGEVEGHTSALVIAEVAHRLMTIEAVATKLVASSQVVKKLRERPELVRKLGLYQRQIELIPLMGIEVEPVGLGDLLRSAAFRADAGLLTNDSLVAQGAQAEGVTGLATADKDFRRVKGLKVFSVGDLSAH